MRIIAVTGSASGIGAATRARIERGGERVIGVDVRDAEVIAELSTPAGRAAAIEGARTAAGGRLDGLVACAGVGPQLTDWGKIVSINYFGAQALIDGLRETMEGGSQPAVVAVSSNSAVLPGTNSDLVDACLNGDETRARAIAASAEGGHAAYASSKLALARWVRRAAPGPQWAGRGIRLNAVAPGAVMTPLLQAGLDHPVYGDAIRNFPIPTGGFGTPEQIAAGIAFLLSPEASFCCGVVLFIDGGTDAMVRADSV